MVNNMRKDFIRKVKAMLLTVVILTALTLFTILTVGVVLSLMSVEYTITIEHIKTSFLGAGCGIGLAAVYKDMLDYLGKD
jgi:hypothetical protein